MTCTVLLNDQSGLVGSVHLPLKDLDEGKKRDLWPFQAGMQFQG